MLSLLLACSTPPPAILPFAAEGDAARPDVILVTLDTTRADRLGAYGYAEARTDTIDGLAASGIRFDQAISPLPLTIPSHATMFTGLLPYHHNIRSNGDNVLGPDFTTLAEQLKGAGFQTGASVAAFVTSREWGFSQGFDAYFDSLPEDNERNFWHVERTGDQVVDDAVTLIQTRDPKRPMFLWVHLYDAHLPYAPPAEYLKQSPSRPYDAELAFVDDQIQRLVTAQAGRSTVWCLIGDHGESLGEHNELTHGNNVYQATQRVPWILSGAGVQGGVVKEPVSTADLTPTLLHLLGLAVPEGLDGKIQPGSAQLPYSESYQLAERFRLAPQQALVDGRWKLVANPKPELYDIVADPGETADLASGEPERVQRMLALLKDRKIQPPGQADQSMTPDTLARLASLGYVSEGGFTGEDPHTFPDPKDYQDVLSGLMRLESGSVAGPKESMELLRSFVARLPRSFELQNRQFMLLTRQGEREQARGILDQMTALFPDQPRVWLTLAGNAMQEKEYAQALNFAERAMAVDAANVSAQEVQIQALMLLGREEEAVAIGRAFVEANPRSYGVAAVLGRWYLLRNNLPEAERYLRMAVSATNPRRGARVQLALLARAASVRPDAYRLLREELKEYPGNLMARRLLSTMLGEDGDYMEQTEQLKILAASFADDDETVLDYAQARFNASDYRGCRETLNVLLARSPDAPDVLLLHANLLAKEGKREEGRAVFMRADALHTERAKKVEAERLEAARLEAEKLKEKKK